MIGLLLVMLAAKGPPLPQTYCEGDRQILHLPYADIAVGASETTLRDAKAVPKPTKAASLASKTLDVTAGSSSLAIRPDGWTLVRGESMTPVTPPKGALGAETRLYGVRGTSAWVAGTYWIARVDLTTGELSSGKLLRDGRNVFVLDVAPDSIVFATSDRLTRCGADAVCAEVGRVPFSIANVAIGQTAYLFASDAWSDKLVRVMRDKLETAIPVETGTSAIVCPLGNAMAVYLPSSVWTVTRVLADPPPAPLAPERREKLIASALASSPAIGANATLFDTALREKWPELETFGLIATNDSRPEIRATVASAFATVPTTRGFATLWLLGRDSDAGVRSSALDATARWCSKQRVVPCTSALKQYMSDPDTEVSWLARDHLLVYDPVSAMKDASADYKRDAISHLAQLMVTSSNPALKEVLTQLTYDTDVQVRTGALETLGGMGY